MKQSSHNRGRVILHGLVVLDRTGYPIFGMNKSILSAEKYLQKHGIRLYYIAASSSYRFIMSTIRMFFKSRRLSFDFVIFNSAASIYYVNIHGIYTSFALPLFLLFKTFKMSIYIYWHETEWAFKSLKEENSVGFKIMNKIASDPDVIHLTVSDACSRNIKKHYTNINPLNIHNCTNIPDDYNYVMQPSNTPRVINIASIQERKGTDLFVKTAIEVCGNHPTVEFIWIGSGDKYGIWDKDIRSAGLQNRILFPGYIKHPHIILRNASVFFLSSRDDPFPLTVLEAMCLARTIITFNVGGAPEALGGHGILVKPFDTDEAANEILKLLDKPPKRLINEKARKRYYQLYTPEIFAAKINEIVRKRLKTTK